MTSLTQSGGANSVEMAIQMQGVVFPTPMHKPPWPHPSKNCIFNFGANIQVYGIKIQIYGDKIDI